MASDLTRIKSKFWQGPIRPCVIWLLSASQASSFTVGILFRCSPHTLALLTIPNKYSQFCCSGQNTFSLGIPMVFALVLLRSSFKCLWEALSGHAIWINPFHPLTLFTCFNSANLYSIFIFFSSVTSQCKICKRLCFFCSLLYSWRKDNVFHIIDS